MDPKDVCKGCKGQKVVDDINKIELSIEPGVPDKHDYI